ncbi:aldo/keto reductase [Brevibacillus choshinensis]|uniref:Aldo/keto reductase n=1 Tax=Brevibacillus choshinensis TaxID=54911 RepID=A0ABX7FP10_BRECH|nr:aldo/keto reductase [Brevibacillus choshinensis]QRG67404.1 aldo/keto reductase [Brevibacillus choshinensis]
MQYRNLARTGISVSQFALGGGVFGALAGQEEGSRIIDEALDAGINMIDTSNRYGDGESERIIGEAIKGRREKVILATKFGAEPDDERNQSGVSRRWVRQAVEQSLLRLQTDYIDLYQLHRPFGDVAFEEILGVLSDLVQEGKVHYIGTSNHQAWQLSESQAESERRRLQRFVSEQSPYSILNRSIEMDIVEVARRHDFALLTYSPLAGGLLTGKYASGSVAESGSRAALLKGAAGRMLDPELPENAQKFAIIEKLKHVADQAGMPLAHMAVAFARTHPAVTSIIVGPRTSEQLRQYINGADLTLSPDLLDAIDEIVPPGSRMDGQNPAWTPEWLDTSRRRP